MYLSIGANRGKEIAIVAELDLLDKASVIFDDLVEDKWNTIGKHERVIVASSDGTEGARLTDRSCVDDLGVTNDLATRSSTVGKESMGEPNRSRDVTCT
jgi:hypothetical protein